MTKPKKRNYGEELDEMVKIVQSLVKQLSFVHTTIQDNMALSLDFIKLLIEKINLLEIRIKILEDNQNGAVARRDDKD